MMKATACSRASREGADVATRARSFVVRETGQRLVAGRPRPGPMPPPRSSTSGSVIFSSANERTTQSWLFARDRRQLAGTGEALDGGHAHAGARIPLRDPRQQVLVVEARDRVQAHPVVRILERRRAEEVRGLLQATDGGCRTAPSWSSLAMRPQGTLVRDPRRGLLADLGARVPSGDLLQKGLVGEPACRPGADVGVLLALRDRGSGLPGRP